MIDILKTSKIFRGINIDPNGVIKTSSKSVIKEPADWNTFYSKHIHLVEVDKDIHTADKEDIKEFQSFMGGLNEVDIRTKLPWVFDV